MLRTNRYAHFLYLLIDILLISASFAIASLFNHHLLPNDPIGKKVCFTVFLFWGIFLVFILNNFHLYTTSRYLSILQESLATVRGVMAASLLTALFVFLLKVDVLSRTIFVESILFLLIFTVSWRVLKRMCVRKLVEKGFSNYNVLIIGAGEEAALILQEISDNAFLGLRVKGILDDKKTGEFCGYKILGRIKDLEYAVKKYFIDEIYIAGPLERSAMRDLLSQCKSTGKTVRAAIDEFGSVFQRLSLNYLGSVSLITYFQEASSETKGISKRIFDIAISGILLVMLFPIFFIIGLLIKMESKGPVFYVSKRSGKRGAAFNFYKFRSMVSDADNLKKHLMAKSEVDGPIFKIKDDPRITKMGRFLRKYSLDELPQLINVFKGDMSLVGPRPFPVEESNRIEYKHIPRLNIYPGITGMAQIKGRSDLKFNNWMRWDIWYVKNWSFGLDIKILLWTIPAVLKGRGAY